MVFESEKNIHELKQKILEKQQIAKQRSALLEERETLENIIINRPQDISHLKECIQKIDHCLDSLPEEDVDVLLTWKQELIFQKCHCSMAKSTYSHLINKQQKIQETLQHIDHLLELLTPLQRDLSLGLQCIKQKRSLFQMLFGRHPKALLAHYLLLVMGHCERFNKMCSSKSYPIELQELIKKIVTFFEILIEEIKKHWNPSLYKDKIFIFYDRFLHLWEKLVMYQKECLEEEKKVREEEENWLLN